MANTPITSMPVATSLDGTELVPIIQPPDVANAVSKRATTRQIAALAGATSTTGITSCTASGTPTAVVLTPIAGGPAITGYSDYQLFAFVATVTGDAGGWTITVVPSSGSLSALPAYHGSLSGPTVAGATDMISGNFYLYAYVSSLNNGAGGFYRISGGLL